MREAFSGSYGYDNELLGLGLTEIMKDCLIVIVLISLFLITVVMVFYRKNGWRMMGFSGHLACGAMPCSGPGSENYLPDLRWHW